MYRSQVSSHIHSRYPPSEILPGGQERTTITEQITGMGLTYDPNNWVKTVYPIPSSLPHRKGSNKDIVDTESRTRTSLRGASLVAESTVLL